MPDDRDSGGGFAQKGPNQNKPNRDNIDEQFREREKAHREPEQEDADRPDEPARGQEPSADAP